MSKPGRTVALVKPDPFGDIPAYDPAFPAASLAIPSRTFAPDDSTPPDPQAIAAQRVADAKQKYLDAIAALETATTKAAILEAGIQIQRRRAVWLLMKEVAGDESDPDVLKELGLLSKMVGGSKGFDEDDDPSDIADQDDATALLESRGLNPDSASRVLRTLGSLLGAGGKGADDERLDLTAFGGPRP